MEKDKLLPCPFCGEKATAVGSSEGWKIYCSNCFCLLMGSSIGFDSFEDGVKGWNRRSHD